MKRDETEALLREMYAQRLANDLDQCVAYFAPTAMFELCGSEDASPIPCRCEGDHSAMRDLLTVLIDTWRWKDIEYLAFVIDGDSAVIRYRLTVEFVPLGETVTTEITDHAVLRDGKIAEFSEFVDTAMVASLAGKVEAA